MKSDERMDELAKIAADRETSWDKPHFREESADMFTLRAKSSGEVELVFHGDDKLPVAEQVRIVLHALVAWSSGRQ